MTPVQSETVMAARAARVLGQNSDGAVVKPALGLYPHQWSWDSAFISIGLARLDVGLARANLDALFRGQWRNGMVPHIVFDPAEETYFPGADRWACAELTADAPRSPRTSGICQPPLHAVAASAILHCSEREGSAPAAATRAWLSGFYPKLLAWHRFLARERAHAGSGLVRIFHGWESGMDNSPRWDGPYSRVAVGAELPPYKRRDLAHVTDPSQRPTGTEYDRYLWLVEEAKQARYDQALLARSCSFDVGDVFFTALFATASDHLADLAELLEVAGAAELREYAEAARAAVERRMVPPSGLTTDLDLRTGEALGIGTIAGFSPLIAGHLPAPARRAMVEALTGPRWAGQGDLRWPVPPSTSPCSPSFRPRSYWRGPVWPVMTWLLTWSLERAGEQDVADGLRRATISELTDNTFAEYYEPLTGEPLGTANHSWTAAVIVDWLCR